MDSPPVWIHRTTTDFDDQLLSTAAANITDFGLASLNIRITGFGIYFYALLLFIIPVGVACNIFSVCVFVTSPTFRANSTAQFLIALSIADCLVLVGDALRCLSMRSPHNLYYTGLNFFETSDFACKFINYWRHRCPLMLQSFTGVFRSCTVSSMYQYGDVHVIDTQCRYRV